MYMYYVSKVIVEDVPQPGRHIKAFDEINALARVSTIKRSESFLEAFPYCKYEMG